ncbi:DUF3658 domain-containing protein [Halalkalibacter nanhaiisediminis]|uniref:Uncharacterized protein DUF1835 n=1 Tax=Halalkalibacter nanhaiisediminis TaxID=688079 RepID=A0A562QE85_9BACI|nr:DUF3658 domain-containing protein [Halalkalibacter nanhaiisediminis]TWI54490.1 uncharacterized protein DUF1835 [Halalkalibacter nanhaiisediminis]
MLHIVFSHTAEQMLKQAFKEKLTPFVGEIVTYEPQLQLGDLINDEERLRKWAEVYQIRTNDTEIKSVGSSFKQTEATLHQAIQGHDRIVFWIGETAADELAFLRLLDSLGQWSQALMLNRIRGPLLVGELIPENVDQSFLPVPLSKDSYDQYCEKWKEVSKQGDKLRIREDDFVYQFVDYSHYDVQMMLHIPETEPVKMAVVIGEMYGAEPHLPYFFFVWRIYQLAKKGMIEIVGEEKGIRQTYVQQIK